MSIPSCITPLGCGHSGDDSPCPTSVSLATDGYKWVALSNTTLGMLAAAMNSSILLISLPAVFRGIGLQALDPGNINYLLWAIIGYMIATAVLVVAFGRLGDQFGRARMYNLGFAIFTLASLALSLLPGRGDFAATYLIAVRIVQGVGGALIMANCHRHHYRCFSAARARAGARHQRGGGDRRAVHRSAARRPAGGHELAAGVLDQRADRRLGHGLGVS